MVYEVKNKLKMFHGLGKIIFDPAGIMGASGTILLGITALIEKGDGLYTAFAGIVLIGVSVYQKINMTKRGNAKERREQALHNERMRVLKMYEMGDLPMEMAKFLLDNLGDDN